MALNFVSLLVLLLACCLMGPTHARNLDIPQRSFGQSDDADREFSYSEEARRARLPISTKEGPISSFAETVPAKEVSTTSVSYHKTGREENTFVHKTGHGENPFSHGENIILKSALHPIPELSFYAKDMSLASLSHKEEMSLPSLSRAEDISVSHDKDMSLLLLSHTEDVLVHESELVLHDDDTIPSLLDQNGLPIGLLPSSVARYSITDDGEFSVSLEKACYVKFDYEVYYAQTITGKLSYGTITDLSGIQAKEAFFWVPVTGIRTDIPSSEYIYFDVGPISKKLSISQFQTIPVCKVKAMAFSALA